MKKRIGLIILSMLLVFALASCSNAPAPAPAPTEAPAPAENAAPVISGAQDLTVAAGDEIDLLAGLTATDAEDGDLTGMIAIDSTPALAIKNGKATPENAGDYELVFSVTDKGEKTAEFDEAWRVAEPLGIVGPFIEMNPCLPGLVP